MHWFHGVGDLRWLAVFWVSSFLIMLGAWWLYARAGKPKDLTRPRRRTVMGSPPYVNPYEQHPRPSA